MIEKICVPLSKALDIGPPGSVVLVTCKSHNGKSNIITIGMYMSISRNPPLIAIGISPKRYSHKIIKETKEFVINVPSKNLIKETIFCGQVSGKNHDKFVSTKLKIIPGDIVKPPLIADCFSHLECKVVANYVCGDHTLFVGEVVVAKVNDGVFRETLDILKVNPLIYKGNKYFIPQLIS